MVLIKCQENQYSLWLSLMVPHLTCNIEVHHSYPTHFFFFDPFSCNFWKVWINYYHDLSLNLANACAWTHLFAYIHIHAHTCILCRYYVSTYTSLLNCVYVLWEIVSRFKRHVLNLVTFSPLKAYDITCYVREKGAFVLTTWEWSQCLQTLWSSSFKGWLKLINFDFCSPLVTAAKLAVKTHTI